MQPGCLSQASRLQPPLREQRLLPGPGPTYLGLLPVVGEVVEAVGAGGRVKYATCRAGAPRAGPVGEKLLRERPDPGVA